MKYLHLLLAIVGMYCVAGMRAADVDAPAAPDDSASAMFSLESIYSRLDTGASGAKRAGAFTSFASTCPSRYGSSLSRPYARISETASARGRSFWRLLARP